MSARDTGHSSSGAVIDMTPYDGLYSVTRCNGFTIKGSTIHNSCFRSNENITFENCTIENEYNRGIIDPSYMATVLERNNRLTCKNCTLTGKGGSIVHSDGQEAYLINCTFKGSCHVFVGRSPARVENCIFQQTGTAMNSYYVSYMGLARKYIINNNEIKGGIGHGGPGIIIFDGYNKFLNKTQYSSTFDDMTLCLVNGSTFSMQGNVNQHVLVHCILKVVSLTNPTSMIPDVGETTGTATIITTSGTTITVSGEGTYLDNDGTTDLTIVS